MALHPYIDADQFDYLTFGGVRSPLIKDMSGHNYSINWDIQQARGQSAPVTKINGRKAVQFTVTFHLSGEFNASGRSDFDDWDEFVRVLKSTVSGPTPLSLPIYHPDLARNEITESTLAEVGSFAHDRTGGVNVPVAFLRYQPPKPAPVAAVDPGEVLDLDATIDPNADLRARVAAKTAEAEKL